LYTTGNFKLDPSVDGLRVRKKDGFMPSKKVIRSEKEYDEVRFEKESAKKAQKRIRRKMPTSISLPPEVVEELKELSEKKGIPYQVLMRSFILEGLERMKKSA
jgi:predicted DNA-binding protein